MAHTASHVATSLDHIRLALEAVGATMQAGNAQMLGGHQLVTQVAQAINLAADGIKDTRDILLQQADQAAAARLVTPMTTVYEETADMDIDQLPEMRTYRLEDFKGDREKCEKEAYTCLDWLTRVLTIAENNQLTHQAALRLIGQHAIQDAGRTVRNALRDGKGLLEVILELEVNYSGLRHPDLALEDCRRMVRREKETLRAFGERVRHLAEMATRNRPMPADAARELAKDSFMAALEPSVKLELKARMAARSRMGEPPPDFNTFMAEAHQIDDERTTSRAIHKSRKDGAATSLIHRICGEPATDDASTSDEAEIVPEIGRASCRERV
jgi:hypothetical protein